MRPSPRSISEHAADPHCFLSDASVAAVLVADKRLSGAADHDPRQLALCRRAVFGLALGVHHVTVGLTLPALGGPRLPDGGPEIFYEPAVAVCRADFDWRPGRGLCLFAICSVASTGHQLGQSSFAARDLVAYDWPPIPRVLLLHPSMMGTQFVEFCRMLLREFGPAWIPLSLFWPLPGSGAPSGRTAQFFGFCSLSSLPIWLTASATRLRRIRTRIIFLRSFRSRLPPGLESVG